MEEFTTKDRRLLSTALRTSYETNIDRGNDTDHRQNLVVGRSHKIARLVKLQEAKDKPLHPRSEVCSLPSLRWLSSLQVLPATISWLRSSRRRIYGSLLGPRSTLPVPITPLLSTPRLCPTPLPTFNAHCLKCAAQTTPE